MCVTKSKIIESARALPGTIRFSSDENSPPRTIIHTCCLGHGPRYRGGIANLYSSDVTKLSNPKMYWTASKPCAGEWMIYEHYARITSGGRSPPLTYIANRHTISLTASESQQDSAGCDPSKCWRRFPVLIVTFVFIYIYAAYVNCIMLYYTPCIKKLKIQMV